MKAPTTLRTWLHRHAFSESQQVLEQALTQETLVSERLHVTVLAGLFGFVGIAALFIYGLFPGLPTAVFQGRLPLAIVALIVGIQFDGFRSHMAACTGYTVGRCAARLCSRERLSSTCAGHQLV